MNGGSSLEPVDFGLDCRSRPEFAIGGLRADSKQITIHADFGRRPEVLLHFIAACLA